MIPDLSPMRRMALIQSLRVRAYPDVELRIYCDEESRNCLCVVAGGTDRAERTAAFEVMKPALRIARDAIFADGEASLSIFDQDDVTTFQGSGLN